MTVRGVWGGGRSGRYFCGDAHWKVTTSHLNFVCESTEGPRFTQAEPRLLLAPNNSSLKSNLQLNPRPVKRQGDLYLLYFFGCVCVSFFFFVHNRKGDGREGDCNADHWTVSFNTEAIQRLQASHCN